MSDPRKADLAINLVSADGRRHRFQLFASDQFTNREDMAEQPQADAEGRPTIRLMHDGAWLPPGERKLITLDDAMLLIGMSVKRQFEEK